MDEYEFQPDEILRRLTDAGVDFVVIGGVAMKLHGSSKLTQDLDVMYRRSREQAERIVRALSDFKPRPRGFPENLPYVWDAMSLLNSSILTLRTQAGDVDLLAETQGSGGYDHLADAADIADFGELSIRIASREDLLNMKRAAGRTKDDIHISELEDWLNEGTDTTD